MQGLFIEIKIRIIEGGGYLNFKLPAKVTKARLVPVSNYTKLLTVFKTYLVKKVSKVQ